MVPKQGDTQACLITCPRERQKCYKDSDYSDDSDDDYDDADDDDDDDSADMKIEGCSRVPHNRSLPLGSPQPPPLSQVITLAHDDDHDNDDEDDDEDDGDNDDDGDDDDDYGAYCDVGDGGDVDVDVPPLRFL